MIPVWVCITQEVAHEWVKIRVHGWEYMMLCVVRKVAVQYIEERMNDDRCAASNGIVYLVKAM